MMSGEKLYFYIQGLRHNTLRSFFGFVSHCKHTPSCGARFLHTYRSEGLWKALRTQAWRALICI